MDVKVFWTIISVPNNYWRRYALRHVLWHTEASAFKHCFLVNPTPYTLDEQKAHADLCLSAHSHRGYDTVVKTLEQMRKLHHAYDYYIFSDDDAFVDIKTLRQDLALFRQNFVHTNLVYGSIEWSSIDVNTGSMQGWGYSPSSALRAIKTKWHSSLVGPFPFMKGPCFVFGDDIMGDLLRLAVPALKAIQSRREILVDIFFGYVMAGVRDINVVDMGRDLVEARLNHKLCENCRVLHMNKRHSTRMAERQNISMYTLFRKTAQRALQPISKMRIDCETPPFWHKQFYRDMFPTFQLPLGRNWSWCVLR